MSFWLPGYWFGLTGSATPVVAPALALADNENGTGLTATISGSAAGSTNTLYCQPVASIANEPLWAFQASRAGDGTLAIAVPDGHYFCFCRSSIAPLSADTLMQYAVASSAASSVKTRILAAAQVKIQSLGLAGILPDSVVVKKLPLTRYLAPAGPIALPAVVLSDLAPESPARGGTNGLDDIANPINITLIAADNQEATAEANHAQHAQWRESIARAFRNQRLPGVAEVILCQVAPSAPILPEGWQANYYASALTLTATSREPRGA